MESLRGFLEGGMVWKRDRSRVREWVGEWVGLGGWGGLVREDVARRAHHVRKVVKAGRRRRRRVELEGREVVELEGEMRFPRFGGESGSGSGSDEFDPFVDPSDEDEDEEYGVRSARGEVYPLFYREYSPPGDGLPSRPQRQAAPQHTGSRGYSQEGGCVYSRGWPGVPRIVVTQPLEG